MDTNVKTFSGAPLKVREQVGRFTSISRLKQVLIIITFLLVVSGQKIFAQGVGIAEDNFAIDPSAILELKHTSGTFKGFLTPRMTEGDRDGIAAPATGLIIYNTTSNKLNIYDGTDWHVLFSGTYSIENVNNGLTNNAGTIQLGGDLIQNTTITNNGFDLVLDGNTGNVIFDLEGLITAGNGINVTSGDVDIADNLNVTTNTDISGTLDVAGQTDLAAPAVATNVRGTLNVAQLATFTENIDANNGIDVLTGDLNVTANTNLTGNLDVDGATTLDQLTVNTTDGNFDVAGTSAANISATDNNIALSTITTGDIDITAAGDLNLTGTNVTVSGTFSPDNLDVDGLTTLDGTEINTDDANFNVIGANQVNLNNTLGLQVANATDLNGTLDVAGQTDLAAPAVATNVRGTLNVAQLATFTENIDANNGIDVLTGDLNVTANTNLTGNLDVDGATTLDQLTVNTTDGNFDVAGTSAANISATDNNIALSTITTGDIDITAAGDLNLTGTNVTVSGTFSPDNLDVDGLTTLDGTEINTDDANFNVIGANQVNLNNTLGLQVANATDLNGTLDVAGQTDLAAPAVATNVRGTLNVAQLATFTENIDANNGIDVLTGDLNVTANTNLTGNLDVDGATTLDQTAIVTDGGTFDVTGTGTANIGATDNDVSISTASSGDINITAADNLNLSGTTVNVSGTFSPDNLDVDGLTTLDGTEINTDDANFNVIGANQVNLNNTLGLQVANATDLNGTLDVAGQTDLAAPAVATNVRGTLNVAQLATFTENIDANNGIDVLTGDLNVTANTNLTGNLDVDGATTLDQLTVNTTDGNFDVAGTSAANISATDNNIALSTITTGDIDITAAGDLNLTGTNVTVSGTFSPDNLDVDGLTTLDGTEINTDDANFNVIGANQVNLNNTLGLQVANATDLNGTLDVAGQTDLAAPAVATNVRGTLNVAQLATFTENIDANNGIDVLTGDLNVTANTNLTGNLDVDGATTLDQLTVNTTDGNFDVAGTSAANISATDNNIALSTITTGDIDITAAGDLNLTGTNVTVSGTFSPDNLDVDGLTTLDGTEINTDDANFNVIGANQVNLNNTLGLQVANATDLNGTLDVAGQTDLAAPAVATNVRGTLNVAQLATFTENIDANNGIDVLTGDLNVTANTNLTGNLDVDGATTLDQLTVNTTDGNFDVAGTSAANISATDNNIALSTITTGDIDITAAGDLNLTGTNVTVSGTFSPDNLDVDGLTTLDGTEINTDDANFNVIGANQVNLNNTLGLQVANATDLNGTLDVAGQTDLAAPAVATNVRGTLNVAQLATFTENIDANNGIDVLTGDLNVTANTNLTGNLDVDGATTLDQLTVNTTDGNFDVAGTSAANISATDNNIALSTITTGDIDITAAGDLNLTGTNVTVSGTFSPDNLDVDGLTTLDGTEINTDDANFNVIGANQVNLNNTLGLQVANATDLNGTLDVAGQTDLAAPAVATNVRGTLNVAQLATFTENIDANNGIDVLTGDLNVTANTNLTGNLDVDGATTLDQTAIVTDGGTFDVTGTGTANIGATDNDVSISTASSGDINITAADNLNLSGTTVNVSGTFSPDNLDVDGLTTLDGTEINTDDANFNVIGANQVNLNNTLGLQVANATDLNGTLDVAGQTDLAAPAVATNVRGTLNVAQLATFTENIDANNGIDVLTGDLNVTANTNLTGNLDVDGATTLDQLTVNTTDGNFDVAGTSAANISATDNNIALSTITTGDIDITAAGDLNLTGTNVTVSGTFSPDNLDVDGLTTLDGTEINTDDANFNVIGANQVNLNNTLGLQVANATDLNGTLDVAGQTDLAAPAVATNVRGTLNVAQLATFTENIDANNGIDVLTGDLNVTANTNLTGNLDVDGATTLDQLTVNTTDGNFDVAGTSAANISATDNNIALSTITTGDIDITAAGDLNLTGTNVTVSGTFSPDNLDVDGLTTLDGTEINTDDANFNVIGANQVNLNNTLGLQVANATDLNGTLDVAGQTDLAAPAVATNVRGTLNVAQLATFTENIDANNGIDVLTGDLNVTANTNLTGNLDVDGATTLDQLTVNTTDGNFDVAGTSAANISATDNNIALSTITTGDIDITAAGDLNLTGTNVTVSGTFSPDNLDVDGLTTLDGTEINTDDANFNVIGANQVNLNNTLGLQVANATDLNGTLDVAGQTDLAAPAVATNVRGTLNVAQLATFTENIDANNGIDVLTGDLNVTANTNLTGNLDVDGATTLDQLTVNTTDGNFDVAGTSAANISATDNNIALSTITTGDIDITAAGDLNLTGTNVTVSGTFSPDNLDVDGLTTLDGTEINTDDANFNVIGANQVNLNNTLGLQVANATDLNGTLDVAGQTDLAAPAVATNVRGTLNVAQLATFTENIDANNGIDVLTGDLNVTANTNLTGNLDVDGATTLDQTAIVTDGGTFDVTGTGTANIGATDNDVSISTASSGDINITAADNLNLSGTTVNVSGTFSPDNLDVDGATTLDGTEINTTDNNFNVIGTQQVTLNNDLGLQVANATDLNGTLDVAQTTSLAATGLATNVRGTLNVAELATFTENIDANNGIDVTSGNLNVTQNTNLTGNLDVDGATTLDQTAIVTDGGTFDVTGTGTSNISATNNNIALSTITTGDIDITAAGNLNLSGTTVNVSGTFSPDNLDVDGATTLDGTEINTTDNNFNVIGTQQVTLNNDLGLQVANATDLNGTLDVAQTTSLAATGLATNVRGTLNVAELATFTENIDANNGIDVTSGNLNVTQNTNLTGNLDVDGATTLDQTAIVTDGGTFDVTGTGTSNISATNNNIALSTITTGDIDITAAGNLNLSGTTVNVSGTFSPDNLDVDGATTLDGTEINTTDNNFNVIGTQQVTLNNDLGLQVANATDLNGTLDVAQATSLAATGLATNVRGTLNVAELATFTENIDANNGVDVTSGNLNVTQNTNLTGNLDVDGATTLDQTAIVTDGGTFDVTGTGTANIGATDNDVSISTASSGDINITAADNLNLSGTTVNVSGTFSPDNLDVDGATTLDGTEINTTDNNFNVIGTQQVTLNNDLGLQVANATDLNGTLDVAQATSLAATGLATNVRGTLNVAELATFTENIDANNGIDVTSGNLNVTQNTNLTGNLDVDGATTLDGTEINTDDANFNVIGANQVNLNNNLGLQVANATDLNGTLDVAGVTNLAATGLATNVRGELNVAEQAIFTENIDANNGIDVTGNITVTGTVDGVDIATEATNQAALQTLTGTSAGDINLGTFAGGSTISDNVTIKTALSELEISLETQTDDQNASEVTYDNSVSLLAATDVQAAIDELEAEKLALAGGTMSGAINMGAQNITNAGTITAVTLTDGTLSINSGAITNATNITGSGTITGGTLTDGTLSSTAGAIAGATTITASGAVTAGSFTTTGTLNADGAVTLAATTVNTDVLGLLNVAELATFTGNIDANSGLDVTGNITVTGTVDGVDIATEATNQAALQTLTGTSAGDINLGTFAGGSTISDNVTIKTALSELEISLETQTDDQNASEVTYDNSVSLLAATDVQAAIDELEAEKLALAGGTMSGAINMGAQNITNAGTITAVTLTDGTLSINSGAITNATNITGSGTITGGTLTDGTLSSTAGAIAGATTITASGAVTAGSFTTTGTLNADGAVTLAATTVNTDVLGLLNVAELATFTGNIDANSGLDVTGNITVTGTVDGVDIATEATNQAALQTLTGTSAGDINLGTFAGGSTISDNVTIKTALSELEISLETQTDDQNASEVTYDNSVSLLAATDVQAAIDELEAEKLALAGGTMSGAINMGAQNITNAGTITAVTLTDGTLSINSGAITNATNITGSGTITGGTITDGTLSSTAGAIAGATTITASGAVTAGSFTTTGTLNADGATTLNGNVNLGNLNTDIITVTGTVQGLTTNNDIVFDEATNDLTLAVANQVTGIATLTVSDLGGVSGNVVVDNATQTLTNKTLTSPILSAGTATAGTAPLKFITGADLTTPEDGAVEYDGTNYSVTSGTTRYTLAKTLTATAILDFPNTANRSSSDLFITVTGATDGDAVVLGIPNSAITAYSSYLAWVSADDTVTVRFINLVNAFVNPASGTFRVSVIKY